MWGIEFQTPAEEIYTQAFIKARATLRVFQTPTEKFTPGFFYRKSRAEVVSNSNGEIYTYGRGNYCKIFVSFKLQRREFTRRIF